MGTEKNINSSNILGSMVWRILEQFFTRGCSLVVQIVLARLLLPADFGNLAIIIAIVNYLSVFVQSGLSAAIIQKKELSQKDINTLFTISMSIAFVLYIFLFLASPFIADYYRKPELLDPLRITSLLLFLYSINAIQIGILSRSMSFKTLFIRHSIAVPLAGSIGIILAYAGYGLWALIIYILSNILLAVILMFIKTDIKLWFQFSKQSAYALYSFSIKILGANMISGFSDLFRTMTIGKKYTSSQLAYYDRGYTYSLLVLQIINSSVQSVLLPVFSREQDNIEHLKEMTRKSVRISMFVMAPFLLGMAVIAKPLILLLLTEKWLPCVPFFMLFLVFRLAGSIVGIDKQVFMALGKSSILFYFELALLVANIIMLLITIPISVKAIAVGAFIVEYLSSFVLVLISKKIYLYKIRERIADLYRPVINSIIMMGAMWSVSYLNLSELLQITLQIIVALIVYILLSHFTKDNSLEYVYSIVKNNYNRINNNNYD